ncbi:MAG: DUF4345 family protein [Parasphingopyxis sp.]
MHPILRILIGLLGLLYSVIGTGYLLQPTALATSFFVEPVGVQGLATLRADFSAFFLTTGLFALYAAAKSRPGALVAPLFLVAIAFIGRIVSLALDGMAPTALQPMVVEALTIVIFLLGYRSAKTSAG